MIGIAPIRTTLTVLAAALVLTGCVHYSLPRHADDGVYYQDRYSTPTHVYSVDPWMYPYWSLDYFYFSHHYRPYSVVIGHVHPWYHHRSLYHPWHARGAYYAGYGGWHGSFWLGYRYSHYRQREVHRHPTRPVDSRHRDIGRFDDNDHLRRSIRAAQAPRDVDRRAGAHAGDYATGLHRGRTPVVGRPGRDHGELARPSVRHVPDETRSVPSTPRRATQRPAESSIRIQHDAPQRASSPRPSAPKRSAPPPRSDARSRPERARSSGDRRPPRSGDRRDH